MYLLCIREPSELLKSLTLTRDKVSRSFGFLFLVSVTFFKPGSNLKWYVLPLPLSFKVTEYNFHTERYYAVFTHNCYIANSEFIFCLDAFNQAKKEKMIWSKIKNNLTTLYAPLVFTLKTTFKPIG